MSKEFGAKNCDFGRFVSCNWVDGFIYVKVAVSNLSQKKKKKKKRLTFRFSFCSQSLPKVFLDYLGLFIELSCICNLMDFV